MTKFWKKKFENGNNFGSLDFTTKMAIFWQY